MIDFFLAPVLSCFSARFYQGRLRGSQTRGFLYIGYLSFLFSLGLLFAFQTRGLPATDELVHWIGNNTPALTFTREGVRMSIDQPLLLAHPQWGALFYFDPQSDFPRAEDLQKAMVVIARKQVAFHGPRGNQYRIQDLTPRGGLKKWRDLTLTGIKIIDNWGKIKPFLAVIFLGTAFLGIYLWKLLAGLFYSLIGLLWNRFRKERLGYPSILNLTFFAMGPITLIQIASAVFPLIPPVLGLFPVALIVTSAYLAFGILQSQT